MLFSSTSKFSSVDLWDVPEAGLGWALTLMGCC